MVDEIELVSQFRSDVPESVTPGQSPRVGGGDDGGGRGGRRWAER